MDIKSYKLSLSSLSVLGLYLKEYICKGKGVGAKEHEGSVSEWNFSKAYLFPCPCFCCNHSRSKNNSCRWSWNCLWFHRQTIRREIETQGSKMTSPVYMSVAELDKHGFFFHSVVCYLPLPSSFVVPKWHLVHDRNNGSQFVLNFNGLVADSQDAFLRTHCCHSNLEVAVEQCIDCLFASFKWANI